MTYNGVIWTKKLKPCPFCGGIAIIKHVSQLWEPRHVYWSACQHCHMSGKTYSTEAEAIDAWNMRVEQERTCVNELDNGHFGCSVCGCHVRNLSFGSTYVSDGKRWYSSEKRTLNYCPACGAKVME